MNNKYARDRYKRLQSQGVCPRCLGPLPQGQAKCDNCREKDAENQRRYREHKEKSGLCARCGKPTPNHHCDLCLANERARAKEYKERCADKLLARREKNRARDNMRGQERRKGRIDSGLCRECGKPRGEDGTSTTCRICQGCINATRRGWYRADPGKWRAISRRYYDPISARAGHHRRRARLHKAQGTCSPQQLGARWDYYGGVCYICRKEADCIDHVVPISRGGTNWPANLRPACHHCNQRKGTLSLGEYLQRRRNDERQERSNPN